MAIISKAGAGGRAVLFGIGAKGQSNVQRHQNDEGGGGGGGGSYVAKAVHFDGTVGDKVLLGTPSLPASATTLLAAGFVGNSTGDPNTTGGGGYAFNSGGGNSGGYLEIQFLGIGAQSFLGIEFPDASKADIVSMYMSFDLDITSGWHSFSVSVETSTQTLQVYIDRAPVDVSSATWSSSNAIAFVPGDPYVVDTGDSGEGVSADISVFMVTIGKPFFDLSDVSNLDKLFTVDNKPADWGADGSSVTGTQPQIFFNGDATNYGHNAGSAGDFVPSNFSYGDGTLTNATTSPSD